METVLLGAAALACPIGMGLMMLFMAKGMRRKDHATEGPAELDDLRAEHGRLGEEIARREATPAQTPDREMVR